MVGVLHEARVDLHLAREHRLELLRQVRPGRDLVRARGQLRVRGDDAQLLLAGEGLLADRVPAGVEAALVFVAPFLRRVVRRMGRSGGEVHEERLVGHQRLLLPDPGDRVIRQILGEVVALLRRLRRLDRRDAVVERRVVLVGLRADEPVEVLEAAAQGPLAERPYRARLPDRHLVALPQLGGAVAVEFHGLRQRRSGIRSDGVVAGRRGGDLRDAAHADRVVVAAGK